MQSNNSAAKQRYEDALKQFWDLQKVEETEEEKVFNEKLQELERLSQSWRESQSKVQKESTELLGLVQNYDDVKSEYDFLVKRYDMLKKLLKEFELSE